MVASSDPADVFARLRALRMLGPHPLEPRPTQRLRDRYFDTPLGDLWSRRLALREREVDGEPMLALKGDLGPRERLEIEGPDDEDTRKRIQDELGARGVGICFEDLEMIQERETTREIRAVTAAGRTIADLDLDDVRYWLGAREIRLPQVEVELVDVDADLDALVADLLRAVPELREWPFDKLVTGRAMAKALDRDDLLLRPDGALPPEAFDTFARWLTGGDG